MNQGIAFDVHETPGSSNGLSYHETLSFMWRPKPARLAEGVQLTLYETHSIRSSKAGKRCEERLDLAGVERLVNQGHQPHQSPNSQVNAQ